MTADKIAAGFTRETLQIFDLPGFAERMSAVKACISPRLALLAEELCEPLSHCMGEPLHIHIAKHLRRTVNPPEATWAAFARTQRAYKPVVHLRTAVNRKGMQVLVFVEDYAEDKLLFANRLHQCAGGLAETLRQHPQIEALSLPEASPDAEALRRFALRLQQVKGQHAIFGVPVDSHAAGLQKRILQAAQMLHPFYALGMPSSHS